MNWGRIAIGCRCGTGPEPEFLQAWTRFILKARRPGDIVISPVIKLPHHYAAEALVKSFMDCCADTLLSIDDDMTFEASDLDAMRDDPRGQDYDALMALCLSNNPPHRPIILEPHGAGEWKINPQPPRDAIVDVGIVGLGFTLIRRSLVEKCRAKVGDDAMLFHWPSRGDSEDAMFSETARAVGGRLGVMTKVCVGHIVKAAVRYNHDELAPEFVEQQRFKNLKMMHEREVTTI